MKWFAEFEELLKIRYERLYGDKDCYEFIRRERRNLIIKSAILVVSVCLIIGNDIASHRQAYENIKFNENGEIIEVMRPDNGEDTYSFSTNVKIISDGAEKEKEYYITIEPAGNEQSSKNEQVLPEQTEEQAAEAELKDLISNLNSDTSDQTIKMPEQLENGDKLVWTAVEDNDPLIYFITMIVVLWIVYRSRFYKIKREEKKARESIVRELPEFINKLVLLLNAGVVLNTAFLKITDEIAVSKSEKNYFYRRMAGIAQLVNETNASFHHELYIFAKHSGVKELMRITNIMMDNISKGDDLADKLRRENELLWFARKQQAEEKGRLAETKMTMPLMIMLMVLIMVSISPALMEI